MICPETLLEKNPHSELQSRPNLVPECTLTYTLEHSNPSIC